MSVGKVNASLLGGPTQETTLALANLNFDFALYKFEPLPEYQGLGECLSRRNRDAAESGNEHVLARKLGALFSQALPPTPNLIRAYGKRATEMIRDITGSGTRSANRNGAFSDWTGPDATSIWAAATSGNGAIAAHLLACMLARMWEPPEAAAIWEEIIEARKREITNSEGNSQQWPSQDFAAKIEVTREQISRWDSSARSWLEVADRCRMKQQKQLIILVQDAGIPVNQSSDTYRSVMEAWHVALTRIEKLLEGVPQSINDGSSILALTSWHLFPDMFVIGAGQNLVSQHDSLFPKGTVVTLGQSSRPPDASSEGVFWSLPLAYLKYYGDPLVRTRSLGESTSRLTFSELMQVVLGSLLAGWGDYGRDIEQACSNIVSLAASLSKHRSPETGRPRSWLQLLAESAESYLDETNDSHSHTRSLTLRGYRRYRALLLENDQEYPPLFGLTSFNTMMRLINEMENKISLLRLVAQRLNGADHHNLLIRYRVPKSESIFPSHSALFQAMGRPEDDYEDRPFDVSIHSRWSWEYATALKRRQKAKSKKRKFTPDLDLTEHTRWSNQENEGFADSGEEYISIATPAREINTRCFQWNEHRSQRFSSSLLNTDPQWVCILGDPNEAALFKQSHLDILGSEELDHEIIDIAIRCDWFTGENLVELLDRRGKFEHPKPPPYLECLRSLAAAADAYKLMPGATISTEFFSSPLHDALWMPNQSTTRSASHQADPNMNHLSVRSSLIYGSTIDPRLLSKLETESTTGSPDPARRVLDSGPRNELRTYTLSRSQVFSCIAMFENRKINIDPGILEQVMAISSGGSLYVAMPLISDPFDSVGPNEVRHITGNIGKPGISLMIPPMAPKLKKVDEEKWTMMSHAVFDGSMSDAFQHTSLHLSFTGYQLPLMTVEHGYQGVGANFIETLVSVFDREEWVADLDILQGLSMATVSRLGISDVKCRHKRRHETAPFLLTSVDFWNEFIDRPTNACVFRGCGNWLARLSAVSINAQQNRRTIVLEDKEQFCWDCLGRLCQVQGQVNQRDLLFVA